MIIETERLILRPWEESDAESLYEYAKHPDVGPIAGWPVHTSVENSLEIIREVLSAEETYAVCLKTDNVAIGSIGLIPPAQTHTKAEATEMEIGYWIGVPFWGQGLIPEAVRAIQKHAFEDLHCTALWCGYYDGNIKSKRVQEKCGFAYHHSEYDVPCELMGDVRTEHFTYMTKEGWENILVIRAREAVTGALVGLARATEGNEFMLNDGTYEIIYEALASTRPELATTVGALEEQFAKVEEEKRRIVPGCFECGEPCGRTSNYDMAKLYKEEEAIRSLKIIILQGIRYIAAQGVAGEEQKAFVLRALYSIGSDWKQDQLMPIVLDINKFGGR